MFSFYPSHPRALRYSPTVYSVYPDDDLYSRYPVSSLDSPVLVTNPEVRYRRALGEYLAAEEGYYALRRAREEAKLRARSEAIRQERVRLRIAQLTRARREQQEAREFKQGLAKLLARAAVSGDDDLLHQVVLVMYHTSQRPLSDMVVPSCMQGCTMCANGASVQTEKTQHRAQEETSVNQSPLSASEPGDCECSAPNLESVLRERLQKIAGDEEVQDVAKAILRHLTSATGVSPFAAASSPEVDEGANLSRTHALKGAAAEAAKASFKAHRAEVAEKTEFSPGSPTPSTAPSSLAIIEDIRSALTKLSADFSLPPSLDFSDDEPDGLAYTTTNAPVRVYEQALNGLLEQLDAVESDGDEEVRVVRRAAVKEVEKTIEDVEKRIRDAREGARPGGNSGSAVTTEADLTEGKNVDGGSEADKPEAEELSSKSGDRVDSVVSKPEILPIPNSEVAEPNATGRTDPKFVQEDQPSIPALVPQISFPWVDARYQIEATVSADDVSESKDDSDVSAEQATSDQLTPVPLEPEILITPPDSPAEVSVPMRGTIAPSSTPVTLLVPSIIPDDLPASLRDHVPNSLGEDDVEVGGTDDEGEWTEI